MTIADLIRDTIISLCKANGPYNGQVEIDGIICISGPKEGQQLVIKVHECLDGLIQEEVESWMGRRSLCGNADVELGPLVKTERTTSYRLPSVASDPDRESESLASEERAGDEEMSFVRVAKLSSCRGSPAGLTDPGDAGHFDGQRAIPVPECKLCLRIFHSRELLEAHNETSHNLFTCRSCLKTFTSKSNLERHSRLHTGHKPYACSICNKAFSRKDHLSNHMTKHAFKCNSCTKKFADCLSLASHFTYDHGLTLANVCRFCNKGFSNPVAYEDHVSSHPEHRRRGPEKTFVNGSKKFVCHSCSFESQDALSFYRHQLSHMFKNKSHYSCFLCHKVFDDLKSFSDHSMEHQNSVASQTLHVNWLQHFSNHFQSLLSTSASETNREVVCERSSVKTENCATGRSNGRESFKCRTKRKQELPEVAAADRSFPSFSNAFPSVPNKIRKPNAPCVRPGRPASLVRSSSFDDENFSDLLPMNLKMEKPFVECARGPSQCGLCQRSLDSFETLDAHCLEMHNRSACMFCSKTFAQRANRDRHLCLHTGKKPYNCSECDEKFSRGDKLKMHRMKIHGITYPSRIKDVENASWASVKSQESGLSPCPSDRDVSDSNLIADAIPGKVKLSDEVVADGANPKEDEGVRKDLEARSEASLL